MSVIQVPAKKADACREVRAVILSGIKNRQYASTKNYVHVSINLSSILSLSQPLTSAYSSVTELNQYPILTYIELASTAGQLPIRFEESRTPNIPDPQSGKRLSIISCA